MIKRAFTFGILLGWLQVGWSQQQVDAPFSGEKMRADLQLFRSIREAANSGVHKYRTSAQMDSLYQWAFQQIEVSETLLDFFNILWVITDFEGSLHNGLTLSPKVAEHLRNEAKGYFPYPIKIIRGHVLINTSEATIPLASEIHTINGHPIREIIRQLGKYYTTDGFNKTGKEIGINANFGIYYRLTYGKSETFRVEYTLPDTKKIRQISLPGTSYRNNRQAFYRRHSKVLDSLSYEGDEPIPYHYRKITPEIGALRISSFSIGGNEHAPAHKAYVGFLDSLFTVIQSEPIQHLIVDVRANGGGSDPNDLVTYSYLTDRSFMENKEAWVSFQTPPYWKHNKETRLLGKYLEKRAYQNIMADDFPERRGDRYYQDETSDDHLVRYPSPNAFTGNIYLLVSPRTASAGSLFAAMVAGDQHTTVIGRETQGGYYGHNGHVPIRYRLPHSRIKFMFSVVNLQQDVLPKEGQLSGRGVMPDHEVEQTVSDFINHRDAVLMFTLDHIQKQ